MLGHVNIELGNDTATQLYYLLKDPGERENLSLAETDTAQALLIKYQEIRGSVSAPPAEIELK